MSMDVVLEIIGWLGSGLVVCSLMLASVWRFRWINLIGSTLAAGYNAAIGVWPFFAMNAIIAVINVYWLVRLTRERHDQATYEVVEVASDDAYLRRVLSVHADAIAATHPDFRPDAVSEHFAWLVVRGDETVGVVIVGQPEAGMGVVELDWVSPRFRDFTPGEFVYQRSGAFEAKGITRIEVRDPQASSLDYLKRVGFAPDGTVWVRSLAPRA